MGGSAPVSSGKGGKKTLDAEINLVPFIDLLSCLITFLLISAVWTQISALRVSQTGSLSDGPPAEPDETTIEVRVTLTDRGYLLSLAGMQGEPMPKVAVTRKGPDEQELTGQGYDTKALAEKLKGVKEAYPAQRAVTVASEDSVSFEDLVETIDSIASLDLPDISVTAAVN